MFYASLYFYSLLVQVVVYNSTVFCFSNTNSCFASYKVVTINHHQLENIYFIIFLKTRWIFILNNKINVKESKWQKITVSFYFPNNFSYIYYSFYQFWLVFFYWNLLYLTLRIFMLWFFLRNVWVILYLFQFLNTIRIYKKRVNNWDVSYWLSFYSYIDFKQYHSITSAFIPFFEVHQISYGEHSIKQRKNVRVIISWTILWMHPFCYRHRRIISV